MININDNDELLCPDCKGSHLHQVAAEVIFRDQEDGPGTSAFTDNSGSKVSRLASTQIPHRRDYIRIEFACEFCGIDSDKKYLNIYQHKGNTVIKWNC